MQSTSTNFDSFPLLGIGCILACFVLLFMSLPPFLQEQSDRAVTPSSDETAFLQKSAYVWIFPIDTSFGQFLHLLLKRAQDLSGYVCQQPLAFMKNVK